MNLVIFNKLIKKISTAMPLVKNYSTDDIYNDWNTGEKKYAAVNFNIKDVKRQGNMAVYNAILYFADRLTEKKDNRDLIFDDAVFTITAIIEKLKSFDDVVNIDDYDVVLFEQKFADELAGGYANLLIYLADADSACGYDSLIDIPGPKIQDRIFRYIYENGTCVLTPDKGYDAVKAVNLITTVHLDLAGAKFNNSDFIEAPFWVKYENCESLHRMYADCKNMEIENNFSYTNWNENNKATDVSCMFENDVNLYSAVIAFPRYTKTAENLFKNCNKLQYAKFNSVRPEYILIGSPEITKGMLTDCKNIVKIKELNLRNCKDFELCGNVVLNKLKYLQLWNFGMQKECPADFYCISPVLGDEIVKGDLKYPKLDMDDWFAPGTYNEDNIFNKKTMMYDVYYDGEQKTSQEILVESFLNYSYDRKTAGYPVINIHFHKNTESKFTNEEIQAIENKGYNLIFENV